MKDDASDDWRKILISLIDRRCVSWPFPREGQKTKRASVLAFALIRPVGQGCVRSAKKLRRKISMDRTVPQKPVSR